MKTTQDGTYETYQLVFTMNTEYHLMDFCCVAARSLTSGQFITDHPLLGRKALGCVTSLERRSVSLYPVIGGALWFDVNGSSYLTSRIVGVRLKEDESRPRRMRTALDIDPVSEEHSIVPLSKTGPNSLSLDLQSVDEPLPLGPSHDRRVAETDEIQQWIDAMHW